MFRSITMVVLTIVSLGVLPAKSDSPTQQGHESELLGNTRQLIFEGKRSGEGYFSADGSELVFQSEREPSNPFYQIYVMDLETGDVERISPGTGKTTCAWIHPDKRRVLFASTHDDPKAVEKQEAELQLRAEGRQRRYAWDYDEHFELYAFDRSSKVYNRLTNARGYDAEGSYSPDGQWIAFSSNRHAYAGNLSEKERVRLEIDQSYFLDLYIMKADGSGLRRLTEVPGYDGGPFFSPTGSRVCFRRFSESGEIAEIYTIGVDGRDERKLTSIGALSWAPYYHPSGRYLIFTTNRHGFANFELYIVGVDGGEPVRVTNTDGFDGLPVFSPNGRQLAWTSSRTANKKAQIFMADWDHEAALKLLRGQRVARPAGSSANVPAQPATQAAIDAKDLEHYVADLASAKMEGRETGTVGERMATTYVARAFKRLGLEPAGDKGTYFQTFDFVAGVSIGDGCQLQLNGAAETPPLVIDKDWRPLSFSRTGSVSASPIVFAGYGIVAPATDEQAAYDSFADLDVQGKWLLVFRYVPEQASSDRRQYLNRFANLRYKAMLARDKGAAGLIVVSGPNAAVKDQLVKLATDASMTAMSVPAISVTDEVASRLLAGSGTTLRELQDALDREQAVQVADLPKVKLGAHITMKTEKRTGRNVLAWLPCSDSPAATFAGAAKVAPLGHPLIVLGAHVDHLGRGGASSSRARADEVGQVHYGADDNASGVAGILEIAEYLAGQCTSGKLRLKRPVLFAAWSGEELGLLGSAHFVANLQQHAPSKSTPLHQMVGAYVNLDMIGRLEKSLALSGVGSSAIWRSEIEKRNAPVGLPLVLQDDGYAPTDSTSFYLKGVPVLSAFTGAHDDYHTPRDTPETLNYDGMQRISRFVGLVVRGLATADGVPDFVEPKTSAPRGQRANLRVYLGTIPDYATGDEPGVLLSGVSKGGPAEQAGLRGGDRIVKLAGKTIETIYDYTYALDAMQVGKAAEVVVVRDGARVTLTIMPGVRE